MLKTRESRRLQRCTVWFREVRASGGPWCERGTCRWALACTDLVLRRGPALVWPSSLTAPLLPLSVPLKGDSCWPGPW